jgi:hypothetical protein
MARCIACGNEFSPKRLRNSSCCSYRCSGALGGHASLGKPKPQKEPRARPRCTVDGCDRDARYSSGWCHRHHTRWQRNGTPLGAGGTERGTPRQFLEMALTYTGDGCLLWPFSRTNGYAMINIGNHPTSVSRTICERIHGPPIGARNQAAHSCGNGAIGCITPRHLRWATRAENEADKKIGAEDSRTRYDVGYGATPEDAVLDLRRLLDEYLDAMDPRLDEDREPDPRDDP